MDAAYIGRVDRALRARQDVWGNALLASPGGPTYAGAARYVKPLLLAGAPKQTPLTESGVHYVAFSRPAGPDGAGSVALHVADGSQILAQRVAGRALSLGVGASGSERYGSCLARLSTPRLADGYLPDPRDDVRRLGRRQLRAGVVRDPHSADGLAREPREARPSTRERSRRAPGCA